MEIAREWGGPPWMVTGLPPTPYERFRWRVRADFYLVSRHLAYQRKKGK